MKAGGKAFETAMAAAAPGSPIQELCDEVTCPICLEHFKDPVTIVTCGHNFCRSCLASVCEGPVEGGSCPQCRGAFVLRNLLTNRQLANVVQIAERFRRSEEGKLGLCEKHREPLKFFCEEEGAVLCATCKQAQEHEGHAVIPLEEGNREQISDLVEVLRKAEQDMLVCRSTREKESKDLLKQIKAERAKTASELRDLCHFLEDQEKQLLAQMEETEEEVARKRDSFMVIFSQELSFYEKVIQKLKNSQQPKYELFQEILNILRREEKNIEGPAVFQPALKWKIWNFCDTNHTLEAITKHFKDTLLSGLQLQKANVTLNPDTAHPQLILSQNCKTAQLGDHHQELPNNPERFDSLAIVLGREEFKEGRHFWEVTVGSKEEWAVGVSRKSVKRKGTFSLIPEEGIIMLGRWGGQYQFSIPPNPLPHFSNKLKRIQVCLNCTAGRVSFFDAERGSLLYSTTSLPGETLLPFFWLGAYAQLSLCPCP